MKFRKLRIASSVVCAIACVLLTSFLVCDFHDTGSVDGTYFFVALLLFGFAAAPWERMPSRFSLRTLLIATTLVAVVLALIVWATRQ
jgi:hypothetical protein